MGQEKRLDRLLLQAARRGASGLITVTVSDAEVQIHLLQGKIVGVRATGNLGWDLVDFLLESETVAPNTLVRMSNRASKKGITLEDMLVQSEAVGEEVLQRLVQVQCSEVLLSLFEHESMDYSLRDQTPEPTPFLNPIPIPFLLKRWAGRKGQLQKLRASVPNLKAVYDKVESSISRVLGADRGRVELLENTELSGAERVVYFHCNGEKTVEQMVFASCLGEFETRRALSRLLALGVVHLVTADGQGQTLKREYRGLHRTLRLLSYGVSLVLVAGFLWWRPVLITDPQSLVSTTSSPLQFRKQSYQETRVERALEAYRVIRTKYPTTLKDLQSEGLMTESDLRAPRLNPNTSYYSDPETSWEYRLTVTKN